MILEQDATIDLPDEPFVVDRKRKNIATLLMITSPFILVMIGLFVFDWNSPALRSQGYDFLAAVLFVYVVGAIVILTNSRRIEFYNDHVRLFPTRGKPVDVPYSQLAATWPMNSHGYRVCLLSDEREPGRTWLMYNSKIPELDMWIYEWLQRKTNSWPLGENMIIRP
jgi:hypothetical protein